MDVQGLGIEMVAAAVNFFKNGETLGRPAQAAAFEVAGKNIQNLPDEVFFVACRRHDVRCCDFGQK